MQMIKYVATRNYTAHMRFNSHGGEYKGDWALGRMLLNLILLWLTDVSNVFIASIIRVISAKAVISILVTVITWNLTCTLVMCDRLIMTLLSP
jgi:hypothetical protein